MPWYFFKVEEKFMIDLGEEAAVQRFQELLDESVLSPFFFFLSPFARAHNASQEPNNAPPEGHSTL